MKRPGLIFLLILLITASCKNENNIIITGKCSGVKDDYLQLNRMNLNNIVFLDSFRVKPAGKFKIKIENSEPSFYTLGFSTDEFITVVAEPGDRINLEFKGENCKMTTLLKARRNLIRSGCSIKNSVKP